MRNKIDMCVSSSKENLKKEAKRENKQASGTCKI